MHVDERINGGDVNALYNYGVVDIEDANGLRRLRMSKLLLYVVCNESRSRQGDVSESAYLPPAEVLRTIRDYSGDMQELAHIWSFVINFNALASLTMPIEEDVNAGNGKGNVPDPVTMAALRPGAMLLEREDTSLLTEELKVERDEDTGAPKPKRMMEVVTWLTARASLRHRLLHELKHRLSIADC